MRKQSLLLLLLCLSATMLRAERIDVSTARKVAENVANVGSGLRSAGSLSLVYAATPGKSGSVLRSGAVDGAADYFVFNVGNENGFVIVAGDDRVRPVLGYSDEGSFSADNLPPSAAAWLEGYQVVITRAVSEGIQPSAVIRQEWNDYLNKASKLRATPVSLNTPLWGQDKPYNQACPKVAQGTPLTGCVATAMAIVMKYYEAPTEANASTRRTDFNGLTVTYAPYQWKDMLSAYGNTSYTETQANAVAQLMWHCGANVSMKYGLAGSSAYMADAVNAMTDVFNYPTTRIVYPEGRTVSEWEGLLKGELDARRPVLYEVEQMTSGHVFVFDGYDAGGLYHANWGWEGYLNGYFPLYVLDPDENGNLYNARSMAIGIKPGTGGEVADKHTLRLTQSLVGEESSSAQTLRVDAFFKNESAKVFKGLINLGKVNITTKEVYTVLSDNGEVELSGSAYYAPYTFNVSMRDKLTKGDHVAVVYSLDNGTTWTSLDGSDGVRWYVEIGNNQPGTGDVDFSVTETKDGFADRYLGAGIENEGTMEYASATSRKVCFRYSLKDPNKLSGLKMSYKSYDNAYATEPAVYTALNFDAQGVAWTQPTQMYEGYGSPKVSTLHKLNIKTDEEGYLSYVVEVYDQNKTTLLARFDKTLHFIKPVPLTVTPVQGLLNNEVPFSFSIGKDIDEALKYKKINVRIRVVGDNLSDSFHPEITYKGSTDYKLQLLKEDYKMGTETVTSYVGHIGSFTYLGEDTYSFTFKLNGTFNGKIFVELAAAETEGIFTVSDKIATTGGEANVSISASNVQVNYHNNPYAHRYMILGKDYAGDGKPLPIQIDNLEENADVVAEIKLKDPKWKDASAWYYSLDEPVYVASSGAKLSFDENGSAWIPVANSKIKDNKLSLYLNMKLTSRADETLEYNVTIWNSGKDIAYLTSRDYPLSVIEKQLTWVFTPTEVTGTANQEFPFTIKATNVDTKLSGLPASISLNIEGSLYDEVKMDYVNETGERIKLNVMRSPNYPDNNLCVTELNTVPELVEGREYKFVFRYIGGFTPGADEGGDIQVEGLQVDPNRTTSYNMSVPFDANSRMTYRISSATSSTVISGEMPYAPGHAGTDVIVDSDGIYVIDTENASINSLTIEDGGQVKLKKPLTVANKPRIKRNIPTNEWTTVSMPLNAWALTNPAELVLKRGYQSLAEQEWTLETTSGTPGRYAVSEQSAHLIAAVNTAQTVTFEQAADALCILPAVQSTAVAGNVTNGNYFLFKANPYWENLMINGRAYVLNSATNSFELRMAPVIPPFHAYMIASEAVMNKVSSLRLGDVPTSVENVQGGAFHAWTEGCVLCFETSEAKDIEIYSLTGVRQGYYEHSIGTRRVSLSQGVYLVVCEGSAIKVVL